MTKSNKINPYTNLKKIEKTIQPYCKPPYEFKKNSKEKWDVV